MERSLQLRQLTDEEIIEETAPSALCNPIRNKAQFYLAGRFVSQKVVSLDVFREAMSRAMNPARGVSISMIAENRFLFSFNHVEDCNGALDGSPWHFDGCIVVLLETDSEDVGLSQVDLNWCNFYIHVHDLPLRRMTPQMAMFIGNKIGEFVEMDTPSDKAGITLRVKVRIDVSKPLIRALQFKTENGLSCLVGITYENLPNFCYVCGKLGHTVKGCDIREHLDESNREEGDWPYGRWLRAENTGLNMSRVTQENAGKRKRHRNFRERKERKERKENLIVCFRWFTGSKDSGITANYCFESFPIEKLIQRSSTARSKDSGITANDYFESFPIEKLIQRSSTARKRIKPEEKFFWADTVVSSGSFYLHNPFLHVGDSVFAVSGCENGMFQNLSCISLSAPLKNSQAEFKCPMMSVKYYPLMEEINGLIYVLSRPHGDTCYGPIKDYVGFEVYNPLEDRWTSLPAPPLLELAKNCEMLEKLAYIVIDSKLCISTENYSCAYDINLKKWEACKLEFTNSDCKKQQQPHLDGCGPPFPFHRKAILYKDNIFICIAVTDLSIYSLLAFQIMNGKKAVKVPVLFNEWPSGCDALDLVDLGDDYFALMVMEKLECEPESCRDYLTMMVFKLVYKMGADGHGALNCSLVSRSIRFAKMDRHRSRDLVCSFKTARRSTKVSQPQCQSYDSVGINEWIM